nr:radical SAM protein [candidate division Zixibacteria bacterium]
MAKFSRYNHFQPWKDGNYIAYNARTGAIALMTEENYRVYRNMYEKLSRNPVTDPDPEEKELAEQLKYGGFLLNNDGDELDQLEFRHLLNRYDRTSLGLIVAPTMACNMACKYCFESDKRGRMSTETIEALLQFIEKQARNLDFVDIAWYGGEPLLALNIIEDITESVLDLAREYKVRYASSMITNGYLLTPENVDKLVKLRVSSLQITLDGPRRVHDENRPLKNGRGSYDTILQNIKYASTKLAVGLRVNIDKNFNGQVLSELLEELNDNGLRDKIGLYFGMLEPWSNVCVNIAEGCYSSLEFSKAEIEYYRLLHEEGFSIEKLPMPISVACLTQNVNCFIVDADGDLYKCFCQVGDKKLSFGNIRNEIDYDHPNFRRIFGLNPFKDEMCQSCDILPICMGGCPARRVDRNLSGEQLCESWRHNLPQMLEIIALSKQQQKKQKTAEIKES